MDERTLVAIARAHPQPWRLADPHQDGGGVTVLDADDMPVAIFDDDTLDEDRRRAMAFIEQGNALRFAWHGGYEKV